MTIFVLLPSCCFCPVVLVNMLSCILKAVIQFCTYILERFVHLMTVFINMLCTIYSERQSNNQQSSESPSPVIPQPLPEAQHMLPNQNEIENVAPFSPVSTSTVISLPTVDESVARKALRFMSLPVKTRKSEPDARRMSPDAGSQPSAPPPTFQYRDMPGTPRCLF